MEAFFHMKLATAVNIPANFDKNCNLDDFTDFENCFMITNDKIHYMIHLGNTH